MIAVEGLIGIFIGILGLLFLPRSPLDGRTLSGINLFDARTSHILTNRVIIDDPAKAVGHHVSVSAAGVFRACYNWRFWIHGAIILSSVAPTTALSTYNALITKSLGFTKLRANALASVGAWLDLVAILVAGYAA